MKTFKKALAALALAVLTLPAWASGTPNSPIKLKTELISGKEIVIQLTNLEQANTYLSLRDLDGKQLYREFINKHHGYRALLDLSQLPDGRYILSASQKGVAKSQVILIKENSVLLSGITEE